MGMGIFPMSLSMDFSLTHRVKQVRVRSSTTSLVTRWGTRLVCYVGPASKACIYNN
jgi:hypothetical protein